MVSPCAFIILLVVLADVEFSLATDEPKPLERLQKDDIQMMHFLKDMTGEAGRLKKIEEFQQHLDTQLNRYRDALELAIKHAQHLMKEIRHDFAKEAYLVETSHLNIIRPYIETATFTLKENKKKSGHSALDDTETSNELGFEDVASTGWRPKASPRAAAYTSLGLANKDAAALIALANTKGLKKAAEIISEHKDASQKEDLIRLILKKAQEIREGKLQKDIEEMAEAGHVDEGQIRSAAEGVSATLPALDATELGRIQQLGSVALKKIELGEFVLKNVVFDQATSKSGKDEAALQELDLAGLEQEALTEGFVAEDVQKVKNKAEEAEKDALRDVILDKEVPET